MIQIGSQDRIRDLNTQLILKTLLEKGAMSRADLAEYLHLTKATISAIVQILIEKHLVCEIGSNEDAPRGRKPILLTINTTCGYVLSIDLGSDQISFYMSSLSGDAVSYKQVKNTWNGKAILPALIAFIEELKETLPPSFYGLIGISIAIHGVVHDDQVVFVPYSDYQGINFKKELSEHFSIPVWIDNEANLSVLGEWAFGHHSKNMLSISVHTGIGLGIIIDHHLIRGQNGFAGEFGHTILQLDGRPCPCGNTGCLEQYASARVLLKEYSQKKGCDCSPEDLFLAYKEEDPDAIATVDDFVRYMTVAVSNLLTVFNPDLIILNSTFTNHLPNITKMIQTNLKNRMSPYCNLLSSSLKDKAILLGGVYRISCFFLGLNDSSLNQPT